MVLAAVATSAARIFRMRLSVNLRKKLFGPRAGIFPLPWHRLLST